MHIQVDIEVTDCGKLLLDSVEIERHKSTALVTLHTDSTTGIDYQNRGLFIHNYKLNIRFAFAVVCDATTS